MFFIMLYVYEGQSKNYEDFYNCYFTEHHIITILGRYDLAKIWLSLIYSFTFKNYLKFNLKWGHGARSTFVLCQQLTIYYQKYFFKLSLKPNNIETSNYVSNNDEISCFVE